ncbi:MAG: ATP-binding protein [Alphaproteobacteria bacterium]
MFKSLLVANRGEIAVRVMRTAKRMGLGTIAVYSDADAVAMHVAMADSAIRIGPAPAGESYLNIAAIIAAAKEAKAGAIHPGYGFLAENAEFAEACEKAKIVFVGPPANAIRTMGLKDRAKALLEKAGVPVVPGYYGADQSASRLQKEAQRIGFPLLIKAVAGGGGKGMRRVDGAHDFAAALAGAKREAKAAFGNAHVLLEKFVAQARHIEIQVFADAHGNVVHLFERDCSIQRRHQKVIEEAPAPGMNAAMREAMGKAAVAAAHAAGYVGAGTVEFIADAGEGLKADRFWFMEMNTRLQVEHPVTEAVTGLDLVEWQLRVAAGEKLPKAQKEISMSGHAIEARLYAEDPQKGFLPSTGRLKRLRFAAGDVRVDTGVREGDEVTPYYDPLIAKVIAHDTTREGAARRLADSLAATQIAGPRTNAVFLIEALRNPDFLAGKIETGFVERHPELVPEAGPPPADVLAMAALFIIKERAAAAVAEYDPWNVPDAFRLAGEARELIEFQTQGGIAAVRVAYRGGGDYLLDANGTIFDASAELDPEGTLGATLNSKPVAAAVVRTSSGIVVMLGGHSHVLAPRDGLAQAEEHVGETDAIVAPMPGRVVQLLVKKGERVKRGHAIAVLEAMKMEHTLSAPADATIESLAVAQGDQVKEGAVIARLKP